MTRWCNQIGLITTGLCCCLVLSGCQDDTTENDTSVAVNQVQFTPDAEQQGPTLAPAEGEQPDPTIAEPAEVSETPNEAPLNEEEIPPGVLSPEQPFTEPVVVPLKTIEEPTEQLSVRSDSSSETAARFQSRLSIFHRNGPMLFRVKHNPMLLVYLILKSINLHNPV